MVVEPEDPKIHDPMLVLPPADVAGYSFGSFADRLPDSEAVLSCLTVLLVHHIWQPKFLEGSLQLQSNVMKDGISQLYLELQIIGNLSTFSLYSCIFK